MRCVAVEFLHSASHMILPDRIIEGARGLALEQIHVDRIAKDLSELRQKQADDRKPDLLVQLRKQHQAHFAPLRAVIDPLIDPLRSLRDIYSPRQPIFVAETYIGDYSFYPGRKLDNRYAYGAMILSQGDRPRFPESIIFAVATCVEPVDRRWLKGIGQPPKPRYYLNIGTEYPNGFRDADVFFQMLSKAAEDDKDSINLTRDDNLFWVRTDPSGKDECRFNTPRRMLPPVSDLKEYALSISDPATFITQHAGEVERRLSEVLAPWARRQLMA